MGRTFSTTHPGNFCRALYIPHSNDKSVQGIRQKLSNAVFGFRTAIEDGTRKERDCRSSLLEQDSISLFYCNSRKAILNPYQPQEKRSFSESFLHALLFLEKAGSSALAQMR